MGAVSPDPTQSLRRGSVHIRGDMKRQKWGISWETVPATNFLVPFGQIPQRPWFSVSSSVEWD